ncbi:MAG TPA: hypothetical protein VNN79_06120, partial [Actinomycetota bacterium]|nr:hypothetical protein [Actinomycetota bacterium]
HYGGPFHFKPPFTIGGKERTAPVSGESTSPRRAVGGGGPVTAPQPAPQPQSNAGVVRVAPASATRTPGSRPAALWFLFPAALLALAAVAAVVFEPKPRRAEAPADAARR